MRDDILDDAELRDLAIEIMRSQTERDKQSRLGASDLANQCDRCVAMKFAGAQRAMPIQAQRLWLGAVNGTGIHGNLEKKILELTTDPDSPLYPRVAHTYPEMKHKICTIDGYGDIYGTIDWSLPHQVVDWKTSTRKKTALLRDFLAIARGETPPFGRTSKHVGLSQREYDEQMQAMAFKVQGYFTQLTLYGHARAQAGRPVEQASIVWINRDGNGYFDLPHGNRYTDPSAMHDVWVMSFDYSPAAAQSFIDRAQGIYDLVRRGAPFIEFEASPHCFICSNEEQYELDKVDINVTIPGY